MPKVFDNAPSPADCGNRRLSRYIVCATHIDPRLALHNKLSPGSPERPQSQRIGREYLQSARMRPPTDLAIWNRARLGAPAYDNRGTKCWTSIFANARSFVPTVRCSDGGALRSASAGSASAPHRDAHPPRRTTSEAALNTTDRKPYCILGLNASRGSRSPRPQTHKKDYSS